MHEKDFLPFHEKRKESYHSEVDFLDGISYGLILGIIGNLFVQFLFAFLEGIILKSYNALIGLSITIVVSSGFAIIVTFYSFRRRRKRIKEGLDVETQLAKEFEIELEAMKQELAALELDLLVEEKTKNQN
jgi:hypothetical protein